MKHEQTTSMKNLAALAACLLLGLACATATHAQQASSAYRGTASDPFAKRKYTTKPVKPGPKLIEAPPVESRIQQYKARKAAAVAAQMPAPKPTTAFLLSEVHVTGIFRTPRGWAAMVEADPIKLSYTIYPGETFYNGMLVAIEESRLVFRRESRWTDGRRDLTVEMKPLAAPNAVKDAMTTAATAPVAQSPANSGVAISDDTIKKVLDEFTRRIAPAVADSNASETKTPVEHPKSPTKQQ